MHTARTEPFLKSRCSSMVDKVEVLFKKSMIVSGVDEDK